MGRWLTSEKEREPFLEALSAFLREGAKIPHHVARSDVKLVGFMDECDARQTARFFSAFTAFLSGIAEQSFCFIWLPHGYTSSTSGSSYPMYLCDVLPVSEKNFVRLQSDGNESWFASDAWLVVSRSKKWAVYGEQYGSEMALMLSRDDATAAAMRATFPDLIADPAIALAALGDPSQTDEGDRFAQEFLKNYSNALAS